MEFVLYIMVIYLTIKPGLLCDCPSRYSQQVVCDADLVIKASVRDVNIDTMYTTYSVDIEEVYKGDEIIRSLADGSVLRTPNDSGMCGPVLLRAGVTYILSGMVYDGVITTIYCDFVEDVKIVSDIAVEGLSGQYFNNCNCKIPYEWSQERRGRRHCGHAPRGCSSDSICAKNSRGRCKWQSC